MSTGGWEQPEWSPCNLHESGELGPSLTKFPDFLMQIVTSFSCCGAKVVDVGREKLGKRRERGRIFMMNMFPCRVEQSKYLELISCNLSLMQGSWSRRINVNM